MESVKGIFEFVIKHFSSFELHCFVGAFKVEMLYPPTMGTSFAIHLKDNSASRV